MNPVDDAGGTSARATPSEAESRSTTRRAPTILQRLVGIVGLGARDGGGAVGVAHEESARIAEPFGRRLASRCANSGSCWPRGSVGGDARRLRSALRHRARRVVGRQLEASPLRRGMRSHSSSAAASARAAAPPRRVASADGGRLAVDPYCSGWPSLLARRRRQAVELRCSCGQPAAVDAGEHRDRGVRRARGAASSAPSASCAATSPTARESLAARSPARSPCAKTLRAFAFASVRSA